MRILSAAATLIVWLGLLTLTGCVERQTLDVHPKSGALIIDSADVLYVKGLLAAAAKEYDLEPQVLVSSDMIASYQGGKKSPFSSRIAFILLWQYSNPGRLELDISGPTPIGASILSKRIFSELKTKLIQHFGNDRVRDVSKAVFSPVAGPYFNRQRAAHHDGRAACFLSPTKRGPLLTDGLAQPIDMSLYLCITFLL